MNSSGWLGLVSLALSLVGSFVVARVAAKAQEKKATLDADVSAGALALQIAERADKKANESARRIDTLETHVHEVRRWWSRHEPRDRKMEQHVAALDPTLAADLGPWEPMPELNTPPEGIRRVD